MVRQTTMQARRLMVLVTGLCASVAQAVPPAHDAAVATGLSIVDDAIGRQLDQAVERSTWGQFWGAVLVIADGKPVLAKGYGLARADGRPMGAESLFDLASVSKMFTAAAILKLAESGKLALDDSIEKHLEGVPADKRAITIRHLLQHESGIGGDGHWADDREAMLAAVLAEPLHSAPGRTFAYSNVGYFVLAAIVERASGMRFEQFLREQVFVPARMTSSGVFGDPSLDRARDTDRVVDGQEKVGRASENPYPVRWGYLGAGGVTTTLWDMLLWESALRTDTVLKPESIAAMFTPSPIASREGRYALGWFVRTERYGGNDERIASHTGSVAGFRTMYTRWLDRPQAILVVTNDRNDPTAVTRVLRDVLEPERRESVAARFDLRNYDVAAPRIATTNAVDVSAVGTKAAENRSVVTVEFHERGRGKDALLSLALSPGSAARLASELEQALAARAPRSAEVTPVPTVVVEVYPKPYTAVDGVIRIGESELEMDVIPGTMHPEAAGEARVTIVLRDPGRQFMPSFVKLAESAATDLVAGLRAAGK
jgi:CubicO group peptidase (beta-lactamase class C family)